jgi:S-adenosylmethionine decarboxylase
MRVVLAKGGAMRIKDWTIDLRNHIAAFRPAGPKGSFATRDGKQFAGTHLIVDFFQARYLDDVERIKGALVEAVRVTDATLLHIHLHHFSEVGGVSGAAVLAESHISIHTWPEYGYAALDFFMCGSCNPYLAIPVLRCALAPKNVKVQEFLRGEGLAFDCAMVTDVKLAQGGRNGTKPRDISPGVEQLDG